MLGVWKAREAYCRAVLAYPNRVGLDGLLTEAIVDDQAREMASARLEQIAAKKAKAAERRAKEAADRAAAEAIAPPPPAPEPVLEPGLRLRPLPRWMPLPLNQSGQERASSSRSRQPRKRRWQSAGSERPRLSRRSSVGRGSSLLAKPPSRRAEARRPSLSAWAGPSPIWIEGPRSTLP